MTQSSPARRRLALTAAASSLPSAWRSGPGTVGRDSAATGPVALEVPRGDPPERDDDGDDEGRRPDEPRFPPPLRPDPDDPPRPPPWPPPERPPLLPPEPPELRFLFLFRLRFELPLAEPPDPPDPPDPDDGRSASAGRPLPPPPPPEERPGFGAAEEGSEESLMVRAV
ncbi:MAG TPA: hypothetical protein VMQ59_04910 [Acidimicrobiales bacterium]|nr:hypothetical protein [Acidimicrobiales bacterium]